MEISFSTLLNLFLLASTGIFATLYFFERKNKKALEEELDKVTGNRYDDILGKAKFSELGLMSAGIAHEISNPLTIIQGRVTQLLRKYRDPEQDREIIKGLRQIEVTTERIEKVIKGMRAYIYNDDQRIDDEIPLKELIDNVLLFCGQRLKNHGIELRLKSLEGRYVRGQKVQLEQAILNLINNSFDAIDHLKDKWIEISAVEGNNATDIFFKDSGHGIPLEIRRNMMNPFYTTKKKKGTGLGLPLVKGIAEKLGGDLVYVENTPNTTFMLELPRSEHYGFLV